MKGQNHTFAVDFFALGIMGYEFMLGKRPYNGRSRREIKEQMLSKHVQISLSEIPNGWSEEAADFFNKLLQRKPDIRLGSKGIWELKQHRWMKYFPWDKLINKEIESPFIPEKKDNFDKKYCEANDSINIETKVRYEKYKNDIDYDNYFINFTFYRIMSENDEDLNERNILNKSIKKNKNHEIKKIENKENDNHNSNLDFSTEENNTITNKSNKYLYNNLKDEDIEIKKKNINVSNKKYNQEKMSNIAIKKSIKNISFTMKLNDNQKRDNNKENKNININYLKNSETPKQSFIIKNDNILDEFSNISNRLNKNNKIYRSNSDIYRKKKITS